MTTTSTITIRFARPADASALADLAALDSNRLLDGDVLVAEAAGRLIAAHSVTEGRTVADPFVPAAAAVAVLHVRAAQLAARPRAGRPSLRRFGLRTAASG